MADDEDPKRVNEIPREMRAEIDTSEYEFEEMDPPDWVTDLDREILALLGNLHIIMTPAVIAKNIDRSRSSVSRRLSTLEAGGLVKKPERGHYQITPEGYARMVQKVPVGSIDDDRDWVTSKILTPEELEELERDGEVSF